jgi:hypothetical protein
MIVLFSKLKKGENTAYNGHKKRNGIKIHVCASCEGFPLTIQVSNGAEHDRKLFMLLALFLLINGCGTGTSKHI